MRQRSHGGRRAGASHPLRGASRVQRGAEQPSFERRESGRCCVEAEAASFENDKAGLLVAGFDEIV
jgi:hypothetical protein